MPETPLCRVTADQVRNFRLNGHHLATRLPANAWPDACVCAVQNTPPGSAALALHARLAHLAAADLEQALTGEKRLLQTWSLRAAPHIMATADAPVYTLGLLPTDEEAARFFLRGAQPALAQMDISALDAIEWADAALDGVLGGRTATKDELGVQLGAEMALHLDSRRLAAWRGPSPYAADQTLGESLARFVLPILALRGRCCHAHRRGAQAHFALNAQWLGADAPTMPLDQARSELARRYLSGYGPSTPRHLAAWAGISPAQAAHAWALVAPELAAVEWNGRRAWLLRTELATLCSAPPAHGVRLLPPHDPYLQTHDREWLVPDAAARRRVWRTVGNPGVVLAAGEAVATWRPQQKGTRLNLTVQWLQAAAPSWRAPIEAEAQALATLRGARAMAVTFVDAP